MTATITTFLTIAVASVICNSHGTSVESPNIVGGQLSLYPTRPEVFDIHLHKDGLPVRTCRGSEIITSRNKNMWVTAAECLDKEKYERMKLSYHINGRFYGAAFFLGGDTFHIHPQYNNVTKEHNIALIEPRINFVDIDRRARRLQLPIKAANITGNMAHVFIEWKKTTNPHDETEPYAVHSIRTKIIPSFWCKLWYRSSPIKQNNVCASGWYGKGLNKDDLGTPLVVRENNNAFKLVGIATGVRTWTRWFGLPIEFLDIAPYLDWINNI